MSRRQKCKRLIIADGRKAALFEYFNARHCLGMFLGRHPTHRNPRHRFPAMLLRIFHNNRPIRWTMQTMTLRLFSGLLSVHHALGAFSTPTSFDAGNIQQKDPSTWCYYPAADQTRALSCGGDYPPVLAAHLKQDISIGYYAPDGTRHGGAEWPVPSMGAGQIFLCGSGRVGDGTYQTFCGAPVTADNSIPGPFGRTTGDCLVATAQSTVSDGCYVPVQAAVLPPSTSQIAATTTVVESTSPTTDGTTTQPPMSSTKTATNSTSSLTSGAGGNSSGGMTLSHSDIIAIVFGVISGLSFLFGVWKWLHDRKEHSNA
jgi:hypothetical protein